MYIYSPSTSSGSRPGQSTIILHQLRLQPTNSTHQFNQPPNRLHNSNTLSKSHSKIQNPTATMCHILQQTYRCGHTAQICITPCTDALSKSTVPSSPTTPKAPSPSVQSFPFIPSTPTRPASPTTTQIEELASYSAHLARRAAYVAMRDIRNGPGAAPTPSSRHSDLRQLPMYDPNVTYCDFEPQLTTSSTTPSPHKCRRCFSPTSYPSKSPPYPLNVIHADITSTAAEERAEASRAAAEALWGCLRSPYDPEEEGWDLSQHPPSSRYSYPVDNFKQVSRQMQDDDEKEEEEQDWYYDGVLACDGRYYFKDDETERTFFYDGEGERVWREFPGVKTYEAVKEDEAEERRAWEAWVNADEEW
ncbi:hypothetical protein BU24DRAFT_489890 [Aaosphaeria arxii CBS 175.79]|uniref:Uncharacterized protein n=1 Tax=Aaosphaeria arxii CBS 175.79 TaxID=1450172 RepID=A0A6A5Y5J5_9PLEO|nr:uncharacterized protein BU24DRAFT_489890 [Aaosphaeria arxii CBS 175.79]KAF2020050.1 hypothetical protein BU24DRAFT_489890 [Aaosphaeria arxii CBS 175.79]